MHAIDVDSTAAINMNGLRCALGSIVPTKRAATGVQTDCPYCASQRDSRLMSPLNSSASVVRTPRHSSTKKTAHAAKRMIRTVRFIAVARGFIRNSLWPVLRGEGWGEGWQTFH